MVEQNTIVIAKKWILQAIHDCNMADVVLGVEAYDTAAFLAHQSVEKLLKGLLILQEKKVPKHHHLDILAEELGVLEIIRDDIGYILPDYQISRYPDVSGDIPYLQYNREISDEKVMHAKAIFQKLHNHYGTYI